MLKSIALVGGLLLATNVLAQQSLQSMHARVPAPPKSVATAPAWLASPEVATLRKQLKEQRDFINKLNHDANTSAPGALTNAGGIDFARAQRDPEYAKQIQAKIAAMSQAEQMALAMQMQQATQQAGIQNVVAMSKDPPAVQAAAERYSDFQTKQMSGSGITAQTEAILAIQGKVSDRAAEIAEKASKLLKCSDGEGGCATKADEEADKATLRAARAQIVAEYDRALAEIAPHVEAARKARLADVAAVQKDMAATQYGAAAQSSANKQLLAAYHGAALNDVEQLFTLTEVVAKWAAARYDDRTINFMSVD
jgi:hypothetical protein